MDYAQHLAGFANILEQKRLVTGLEGNASVIDRETGLTYITPSGRMKLLLQPDDIAVVNAAGEQIGGSGRRSSEYFLHEAVYQARPDVNAIVHGHGVVCVAANMESCIGLLEAAEGFAKTLFLANHH